MMGLSDGAPMILPMSEVERYRMRVSAAAAPDRSAPLPSGTSVLAAAGELGLFYDDRPDTVVPKRGELTLELTSIDTTPEKETPHARPRPNRAARRRAAARARRLER